MNLKEKANWNSDTWLGVHYNITDPPILYDLTSETLPEIFAISENLYFKIFIILYPYFDNDAIKSF